MILQFKDLKTEMSPLSIYGGTILMFLLGVWGLLQVSHLAQAKNIQTLRAQAELQELHALKSENVWESRFVQSEILKTEANLMLWQGATDGLIAATLQQTLRAIAETASVSNLSLKTNGTPEVINGQSILAFDMVGNTPPGVGPAHILEALASEPQTILVQEISFTLDANGRRASRFMVSGIIPILTEASPSTEGGR